MRKKIIFGLVILAIAVAGVVAFFRQLPQKVHAGSWTLPDGTTLYLAGVTYGHKHTMRYGSSWKDYLYPFLTSSLRNRLGCKVAEITTGNPDAVAVWFRRTGKTLPGGFIIGPYPGSGFFHLVAMDSDGRESEIQWLASQNTMWSGTNMLLAWELSSFPKRDREIGIRLYSTGMGGQGKVICEFKIPNPGPTHYPQWTAAVLPATIQTNGLAVSLTSFETSLDETREHIGYGRKFSYMTTRAEFAVTQGERAAYDWAIGHVVASAATGECKESVDSNGANRGRRIPVIFPGTLWPEERAWKLELELTRAANFPAAELWSVSGIAVPARDAATKLNLKTNIYGADVALVEVSGPRMRKGQGGQMYPVPTLLHLSNPHPAADTHLKLLEVKDDQGRQVHFSRLGYIPNAGRQGAIIRELDEEYSLTIPEDARTLGVTMAYTKSIFLEFMAHPTVAKSQPRSQQ